MVEFIYTYVGGGYTCVCVGGGYICVCACMGWGSHMHIWEWEERMYSHLYPSTQVGCNPWPIFKQSLTGLNSEFSLSLTSCHTKVEEISLPYYLLIVEGRIIRFIPFPRVLVLCEMQTVLSRSWTWVPVFISYESNHYTMMLSNQSRRWTNLIYKKPRAWVLNSAKINLKLGEGKKVGYLIEITES